MPVAVIGTLDLGTFSANVSALTGSGTVNHSGTGSSTLTVGSGTPLHRHDRRQRRNARLAQDGKRPVGPCGSNSYTGGTTISAGTLSVAAGANLGTGGLAFGGAGAGVLDITGSSAFSLAMAVNLSSNGTMRQDAAAAATFSGAISGSGSLLEQGPASWFSAAATITAAARSSTPARWK